MIIFWPHLPNLCHENISSRSSLWLYSNLSLWSIYWFPGKMLKYIKTFLKLSIYALWCRWLHIYWSCRMCRMLGNIKMRGSGNRIITIHISFHFAGVIFFCLDVSVRPGTVGEAARAKNLATTIQQEFQQGRQQQSLSTPTPPALLPPSANCPKSS